jgi:hypothetical protein
MAKQGGQWVTAATRSGAGPVVRGAIESMMPGELSAKGGDWAIAAVANAGAHKDVHATITQMDDGELEKESFLWMQAAACVGFSTADPGLQAIRVLTSGGGTESGPIVDRWSCTSSHGAAYVHVCVAAVVRLLIAGADLNTNADAHVSAQSNVASET